MKYFTPELYIQGNSPDEDVVDRAQAEWERAIDRYRRHYRKIKGYLPEALRKFHDECCLHDAEVFGPAYIPPQMLPWSNRSLNSQDVVLVAQNINTLYAEHLNTLMFLRYALTAEPTIEMPVVSATFCAGQPSWLYDEIEFIEAGLYSHEILLSDGRVVKLRFRDFQYLIAPLVLPQQVLDGKSPVPQKMASA